ncbi:MAG: PHP domain-containing protein, partial [Methanothrix sp.]
MRFDLHIHSRYSDGRASVEEILRVARRKGLSGIAVTD